MAYEISRSTVAFFSESARELNLGRICPFEFEDGLTCDWHGFGSHLGLQSPLISDAKTNPKSVPQSVQNRSMLDPPNLKNLKI